MWAYPKSVREFTDALVCCVKENPEPAVFNLSCSGVRPEIEPDKKSLTFDKILLHRSVLAPSTGISHFLVITKHFFVVVAPNHQ